MTSLHALLRHVRAARRGRASSLATNVAVPPPFDGYVAWELGGLCHHLLLQLRATGVAADDREAVADYYGLRGPPRSLEDVGQRLRSRQGERLRPRQAHNRLRAAVDALAARLPLPPAVPASDPPVRLEPPRWPGLPELRARVADPHYAAQLRRALEGAAVASPAPAADVPVDGSGAARRHRLPLPLALAQLAADAFGAPQPLDADGAPLPPWQRWRLRAFAWTSVVAACPSLASRPATARSRFAASGGPDAGAGSELGLVAFTLPTDVLTAASATPGHVDALLRAAQEALQKVDGASARGLLSLAQRALALHPPRDLVHLRARLLRLSMSAEAHVGGLSAFDRFHELELLVGPGQLTWEAALELSVVLSVFGHVDEAIELLFRQRTRLARAGAEQAASRNWFELRMAMMLLKRAAARRTGDDLARAARIMFQAAEREELPGPERSDFERTVAQIELTAGELREWGGRPGADTAYAQAAARLSTPPETVAAYDPGRGTIPGSYRVEARWAVATMAVALHTDDREAFAGAAMVALRHWNARPTVPWLGLALRQSLDRGAERFQLDLPAVAPPAAFTGWDHAFRPSARVLTLVDGRSWLCPSVAQEAPERRPTGSIAK